MYYSTITHLSNSKSAYFPKVDAFISLGYVFLFKVDLSRLRKCNHSIDYGSFINVISVYTHETLEIFLQIKKLLCNSLTIL